MSYWIWGLIYWAVATIVGFGLMMENPPHRIARKEDYVIAFVAALLTAWILLPCRVLMKIFR